MARKTITTDDFSAGVKSAQNPINGDHTYHGEEHRQYLDVKRAALHT